MSGYQRINLNVLCENKFASSTVGTPSSPAPFNILNNRNFCSFSDSKRVASFTSVEFHCLMQNLVALNLTFLSLANFRMKMKTIRREWRYEWAGNLEKLAPLTSQNLSINVDVNFRLVEILSLGPIETFDEYCYLLCVNLLVARFFFKLIPI